MVREMDARRIDIYPIYLCSRVLSIDRSELAVSNKQNHYDCIALNLRRAQKIKTIAVNIHFIFVTCFFFTAKC